VIPTLGLRLKYLDDCIRSIADAGDPLIVVVSPKSIIFNDFVRSKVDLFVPDPGEGLAAAINFAVLNFPPEVEFFNWLGDDDLLTKNSVMKSVEVLTTRQNIVAVYGQCEYIDALSRRIGVNHSGNWAKKILRFGPDLIPQPGAMFRVTSFNAVNRLNVDYNLAFDFDLFIKLQMIGDLVYLPEVLGKFRWHSNSLSVRSRMTSTLEGSRVRKSHLSPWIRSLSPTWEIPIMLLTYFGSALPNIRIQLRKIQEFVVSFIHV
jgi:glycosyltransferase involved in cell wall biosynthesis